MFLSLQKKTNKEYTIENKSVYNIGPDHGSEITINSLAAKVHRQFNKETNIIYSPARPREVLDAWVSTDKAQTVLGYLTTKSTDETVEDTINWIKASPKLSFNYHLDLEIINESTPKTWVNKLFNT